MATKAEKDDSGATDASRATEITKQAIASLGEKLDAFGEQLSGDERLTLATAFALARRGFLTFAGGVACERGIRIGLGPSAVVAERFTGGAGPALSSALSDAFCPGSSDQFSIEGLEVEKTMMGSKSVAATGMMGSKSVAAAQGMGCIAGSKSVAVARGMGCFAGAKSVAAARGMGCYAGAKSVAATQGLGCFAGAKSVAAAPQFQCRGAKSVAAGFACRGAKSVAAQGCYGAKSVAAWNPGLRR
jgi:hypothetical protein